MARARQAAIVAPAPRLLNFEVPMPADPSRPFIYVIKDLRKVVPPKREILKGIWLSFYYGAKIGVIGPNGAGKSSLLRIMAGQDQDFLGEAFLGKGYTVGFLEQEPKLDPSKNVLGNVQDGVAGKMKIVNRWNEISAKFAEPMDDDAMTKLIEEQAKVQDQMDTQNLWDLDRQLEIAMDALRCPPSDAEVATLSGGERRRVALCRLLLQQPDLLLLDEPTNHLDAESVAWLERYLQEYPGSVVAITHDRYFLDNVAEWILELDRGEGVPYEGNYTGWLEQKKTRLQQEEKTESARQRTLERELDWVRMAPRARQAKGKARLIAYEKLLAEEGKEKIENIEIYIPPGPRLGNVVIEAKGLKKGYGDNLLMEDLSFKLPPAGIVGIIGPNGAGKTTLFRMLVGEEKPDEGSLRTGETVQLAYIDQSRDHLTGDHNVWEEISGGNDSILLGKRTVNSRAYCSWFNFRGADQQKRVKDLSGGERNRLQLAKLLRTGANVLLLDEPTNDLDVDTLRALEDALLEFAGCVLVISHDRWFLDRIATHMLAFEGDSQVTWFEGNFQAYEDARKERLGAEADQPHRIRYKKLVHG
jgi:ATP-binding cassette ChvD family protein